MTNSGNFPSKSIILEVAFISLENNPSFLLPVLPVILRTNHFFCALLLVPRFCCLLAAAYHKNSSVLMCYIAQVTELIVDYQNKSPCVQTVSPGAPLLSLKCQCIFSLKCVQILQVIRFMATPVSRTVMIYARR